MSLTIRPAQTDDLYATVSLLRSRDLPVDGFADLLRANPGHVLVAQLNGSLVGCAALDVHGEDALLRSVAVASGRWWPLLMVLPITLVPISGTSA